MPCLNRVYSRSPNILREVRRIPEELRPLITGITPVVDETEEAVADCAACGSKGIAA